MFEILFSFQAHDTSVRTMVWSHNDSWMVTGDHAGYVKYWQSNMNNVKMFQAHKEAIRGIRYSLSYIFSILILLHIIKCLITKKKYLQQLDKNKIIKYFIGTNQYLLGQLTLSLSQKKTIYNYLDQKLNTFCQVSSLVMVSRLRNK